MWRDSVERSVWWTVVVLRWSHPRRGIIGYVVFCWLTSPNTLYLHVVLWLLWQICVINKLHSTNILYHITVILESVVHIDVSTRRVVNDKDLIKQHHTRQGSILHQRCFDSQIV